MTAGRLLVTAMLVIGCAAEETDHAGNDTWARGAGRTTSDPTLVTVYKSPTCGCCKAWVEHLRKEGFRVTAIDTADLEGIKRAHDVPTTLSSCHTAIIGDYVVEGHVPASDIRRLLAERPPIRGLVVPGMPQGSPGMETGTREKYEVFTFTRDGRTAVFSAH